MKSILNFQRRSADLITQTKDFFSSHFDVGFTEDYKIKTSTLNNGLKYCTAEDLKQLRKQAY